jgi:hypothetical protein
MLVSLMFWTAVIAAVVGMHSADGNLFYFFAAHLATLSIGLSLRRRTRARKAAPPATAKSA